MTHDTDKFSGEGETAESLNLGDGRDRALVRRAVAERWPIPMDKRDKIAQHLAKIAAGEDVKPDGTVDARAVTSAARTLARMDALNQADEHADRHYERIDEGKGTELVRFDGVEVIVPGLPPRASVWKTPS